MDEERELLFTEFFNQKLKERGWTLRQLSDASGISMKYLESFAHGRFENLPPTPYVHGYFVRLGGLLGFDPEEWWQKVRAEEPAAAGQQDRLPKNRFARKQKRAFLAGGAVVLLLLGYFGLRAASILGQPELTVTSPENMSVSQQNRITVAGRAKNADEVTIGGAQVPLQSDGSFSKDIALLPGSNDIEIKASKFLGRTASIVRTVYYQASTFNLLQGSASASSSATSTGQ